MGRGLAFLYGAVSYVIFLIAFLYAIGFVGNLEVPKSIDGTVADSLTSALVIDVVLLALFAIQHSGMARPGFKAWWTKIVPHPIERSTYVLLASLVLILLYWQWRPIPGVVWNVADPFWSGVLWACFALGWAIVLLSTFMIGHFDLFGLQQVIANLQRRQQAAAAFKEPGFYRLIRHPIMLGFIIAFWATPHMSWGHLLFAAVTTAYILIAIQLEERDLVAMLGDTYTAYRRRVPMLIPGAKRR